MKPGEFVENLERAYFLQRVKIAHKKFEENKRKLEEYQQKYFCSHDFQLFTPFVGCAKYVCTNCAEESPDTVFKSSVYAYKGKHFARKKK